MKWQLALGALVLVLVTGCIERFHGTTVVMTLNARVQLSNPGEHYELYVSMNGAAISIKKFKAVQINVDGFLEPALVDFYEYDGASKGKFGVIEHIAPNTLVESGAEFSTAKNLKRATEIFIVVKKDSDPSLTPGTNVLVFGKTQPESDGVIRARLRPVTQQDVNLPAWVSITFIVAEDNNFF